MQSDLLWLLIFVYPIPLSMTPKPTRVLLPYKLWPGPLLPPWCYWEEQISFSLPHLFHTIATEMPSLAHPFFICVTELQLERGPMKNG